MRRMKMTVIAAALVAAVVLAGCGNADYGTIELSVTDAPIVDEASVTGVFVTFEGVQYDADGEWVSMTGFDGPQTHNLLELTGGASQLLGQLSLPAGTYEQIRFMVSVADQTTGAPSNAGSWIDRNSNDTYEEGTDDPLFVPSGAQTGYKAVADEAFSVPIGGSIEVTADFDLRRAVVRLGSTGNYLLKPVIRIVVDGEAGTISGDASTATGHNLVIYAYADGTFDANEAADPADGEARFPNAVGSANVESGTYTLAFLPEGEYDLVVAQYDGTTGEYVSGSAGTVDVENVTVTSGETSTQNITE